MTPEQNQRLVELIETTGIEYARDVVFRIMANRNEGSGK